MGRKRCKVDTAIETYDIRAPSDDSRSVDRYLVARWTGTDGHRPVGYRKLADWFNKQLLKRSFDAHGRSTIGTRIDGVYEALTGDDDLVRDEVISDLQVDDIDADALLQDMVSDRTMHRHLTDCLGAEKERPEAQTDWERESIELARGVLEEKVAKAASALASKGEFHGADAADIDIRVYLNCPECSTRVPFEVGRRQGFVCEEHFPLPATAVGVDAEPGRRQAIPDPQTDSVTEAIAKFSM